MVTVTDNTHAVLAAIDSAVSGALGAVGDAMAANAKTYVPVDTGMLRESIGYSVSGGVLCTGTSVPYAVYVELGVSDRPGVHFLRNAAALHIDQYVSILSSMFGGALKGGEENVILEQKTEEGSGEDGYTG